MKITEKKKPIKTIPEGVWESSRIDNGEATTLSKTTDLQGNGYPVNAHGVANNDARQCKDMNETNTKKGGR